MEVLPAKCVSAIRLSQSSSTDTVVKCVSSKSTKAVLERFEEYRDQMRKRSSDLARFGRVGVARDFEEFRVFCSRRTLSYGE